MDTMKKGATRLVRPSRWHDCDKIQRRARITMFLFIFAHLADIALSYFGLWQTILPMENENSLRKSDHPLDQVRFGLLYPFQQEQFIWIACINGWEIFTKVLVLIGSWTKRGWLYWPALLYTLFHVCYSVYYAIKAAIIAGLMLFNLITWKLDSDQRDFAIYLLVGISFYLVFLAVYSYFALVVVNHSRKCAKHCPKI